MGHFQHSLLRPMGEDIIGFLQIRDTEQVLDIATGTGEPGLTIASLTPNGKVIGTDIAEDMLAIARENAEVKGLKNYITMLADASELPFTNQTFNAISCRMGFMFSPDMRLAAREMYRVLNP
jgi:ubiquinone/menaquinone biosynthesis C-methylase UbiE